VEQIVSQLDAYSAKHIVLTGGEPLIYKSIGELCQALRAGDRHLTIETAGTVHRQVECDLISISPKLASSAPPASAGNWQTLHAARRERMDVVRQYMTEHCYQLKFVVDSPMDAEEVLDYLNRLGTYDRQRILLMPQGVLRNELETQAEWLKPWCELHAFRYCDRAHIKWFGNRRGT
jgi:7-carboxy-7-deazaguanine synthase